MNYSRLLELLIGVALLVLVLQGLNRLLKYFQKTMLAKGHIDQGMFQLLSKLVSMGVLVIALLLILQALGLNIIPLITFGGIGAAALGFAAKDVIANFCGGLMLHITRPFRIGDIILVPDLKLEGSVEEIGWYLTSVRDKDKRPVYLPNAIFSSQLVINASRMSHHHFLETILLRYEDAGRINPIVEGIRNLLASHPAIDNHLPLLVYFDAFQEYSLAIHVDAYISARPQEEYLAAKQDILLKIQEIILSQGAQIPFPTTRFLTD